MDSGIVGQPENFMRRERGMSPSYDFRGEAGGPPTMPICRPGTAPMPQTPSD